MSFKSFDAPPVNHGLDALMVCGIQLRDRCQPVPKMLTKKVMTKYKIRGWLRKPWLSLSFLEATQNIYYLDEKTNKQTKLILKSEAHFVGELLP